MSSTEVQAPTSTQANPFSKDFVVAEHRSPVYFVSLGCPKNLVDSQVMLGMLEKGRYSITEKAEEAEVIIVNTCSFIQASKEESIETILEMAELKDSANCKVLVASGCLPQRYHKDLETQMPEVDLFIGTGQYHRITELLNKHEEAMELGSPLPKRSYIDQPAFIHTEHDHRVHTGPAYSAYLKLSEGCNRRCAFCIIPKLRGNVRSRTVASLVVEASEMAARGVRELNLVAQDLTEYGMEWKYKENLEMLLPELCKIDGIEWIRLHYVYPDQFSDELLEIIAREPKIVKYLDMPIQHTNDRVLAKMNRRLTKAKLFDLIPKLRAKIPGIVFRTSIIVGFPTETDEEFKELCTDLEALDLDHVGVFRYSNEEGTKAAEMDGQIHPGTKRKRARILLEILQRQSLAKKEKIIGQTVTVLIEGVSEETDLLIKGRMETQAQEIDGNVLINDLADLGADADSLQAGDLVEVEITEAMPHDVVGRAMRIISRGKRLTFDEKDPRFGLQSLAAKRPLERPATSHHGEAARS
ncbi:MAG: 30S ribosomal protein S12 methylthiotransferase RimO [Methylotenera sp.]|nr:30S ribosomal protein S12 methylthiotransferase RimO [Oligoflexia bacterium]